MPGNEHENETPNANAPQFDAANMPWDERIHSKAKTMTADNHWRKRKGVDAATITAVENELRSRSAPQMHQAPPMQPPQQFTPPPMPNTTYAPPPMPQHQAPPAYTPGPPMHQAPPQMPPPQPNVAPGLDFQGFMQELTSRMQAKDANGNPLLHIEYLASVCARLSATLGRQFNVITDVGEDKNAINTAIGIMRQDQRWF